MQRTHVAGGDRRRGDRGGRGRAGAEQAPEPDDRAAHAEEADLRALRAGQPARPRQSWRRRGRGGRCHAARAHHAAACAPGAEDTRGAGEGRARLREERLHLRRHRWKVASIAGSRPFTEFVRGLADAAAPAVRWRHPLSVKTPEIAPDPAKAIENISRQLNLGASTIVFVGVESADEVKQGLAAMRFKSKGGTRPEDVGDAPTYWGLSEKEYREKADLWPLNPAGRADELDDRREQGRTREGPRDRGGEGHRRAVPRRRHAARRVHDDRRRRPARSSTPPAGKPPSSRSSPRARSSTSRAATRRPRTTSRLRMKQGFSVFIMNWGEAGFRAIDLGRKAAGR